jgi:peptidoglycan/LPS O-acetylase OafA/YrhL
MLPYRPDIDGLRALSVLAVIFFHAKIPGFAGGYVGVDVFFVISGYLITQVLMARSGDGLWAQLGEFYARRCRRILPALIAMLLASTLVAYWLFLPGQLRRFGEQLAFSAGLVGNLPPWREGGYFELQAPFAPLVHLWSIAVEEQFYLAFPLVFLVAGRALRRGRRALLCGAALVSFALCVWASYHTPVANFFLAPSRAWELLLGAVVALGAGGSLSAHPAREMLAGIALLTVIGCVIGYDSGMRYPGLYAVAPCLGTAILLVTAARSPSRIARWLSAKPLVFTGLISYSLYLWHVPILAFAGYYYVRPLPPWHVALLLLSTYLLSAASWRYVEAPVRRRSLLTTDSRFLSLAASATAVIASLGLIMWQSDGLPGRLDEADARLLSEPDRLHQGAKDCADRSLSTIAAGVLCRYGPSDASADVVVWGDSHAIALLPAYERIASAHGVRVHLAVTSSCRPLLGVISETAAPDRSQRCAEFNEAAIGAIDAIDPILVILNAYWTYPDLALAATADGELAEGSPLFQRGFERTLRAIDEHRRKICVVGGVPTLEYLMPYAYAMARRRGIDPEFIALRASEAKAQHSELDRHFSELRRRHAFTLVDPKATLCTSGTCAIVSADGRSLYRDTNHLSVTGAHLVGRALEGCFDGVG